MPLRVLAATSSMRTLYVLLLVMAATGITSEAECLGDEAQCIALNAKITDETSLLQTYKSVQDASVRTSASLKVRDWLEAADQKHSMHDRLWVSFLHGISEHPLIKRLNIRSNGQAIPESEQDLPLVDPNVPIAVGLISESSEAEEMEAQRTSTKHTIHAKKHISHGSAQVPKRSNFQVLIICLAVIGAVSVGWISFYAISQTSPPPSRIGAEEAPQTSKAELLLLCASFGACSWGMNVVNKTLIHALEAPALVTGAQMLMTVMCTLLLGWGKLNGTWRQVKYWSFIPVIYFGMLVSSFFTFQYLTLSMLMIIRNMGPLITLPIESCVMPPDKAPTIRGPMIVSLLVVFASAIIYCHGAQTSSKGLFFSLLNMVLAIADRVAQRRLLSIECGGPSRLSTESCMLLNNSIGLIPTILLAMWLGDFARADVQVWFMSINTLLLILSGVIGAGICYFALAVQREISATSFMVLQNVVRMAVVAVGVLVFLDPIEFPWQVGGLILSFSGAFWYGCLQSQPIDRRRMKEIKEAASVSAPPAPLHARRSQGT